MTSAGFHHDMSAEDYHADPATEPSLSSSIACMILERSPLHAKLAHPRLGAPPQERKPERVMEIGSVVHKLVLGRGAEIVIIDATGYQSVAAKVARAEAYEAGLLPILKPDIEKAEALARAVAASLTDIPGCKSFVAGHGGSELVAIAEDPTGVWLRCMMDRFEEDEHGAIVWDLKTGDQPAAPSGLGKRIAGMGYEIQAAFYERVIANLRPDLEGRIRFRWIFAENDEPHLVQVAELDAAGLAIGRKKVAAAIGLWNQCRQQNEWPGYPAQIVTAEYPPWAENAWLVREEHDPLLAGLPLDPVLCRPVPSRERDVVTDFA